MVSGQVKQGGGSGDVGNLAHFMHQKDHFSSAEGSNRSMGLSPFLTLTTDHVKRDYTVYFLMYQEAVIMTLLCIGLMYS